MSYPVKPGGFRIPLKGERQLKFQKRMGNAGNGGRPNPPTIVPQQPGSFPRVNLHPQFRIGAYNNAEESFRSTTQMNEYWKQYKNTNNPIGAADAGISDFGGPLGNAGNGDNQYAYGAGYKSRPWTPYKLQSLGVDSGISQSFPYNTNATNLEGGVNRVWQYGSNLNEGEDLEVLAGKARHDVEWEMDVWSGAKPGGGDKKYSGFIKKER